MPKGLKHHTTSLKKVFLTKAEKFTELEIIFLKNHFWGRWEKAKNDQNPCQK